MLSARNTLRHNADGSVDLYLQASSPGAAKDANRLPTTRRGKFIPMRLGPSVRWELGLA
jgi:hypothetical protein